MYALIILIATTIGAIAGLGGGVIIKPLFDFLGYHDSQTIGVLASFAVFTMSIIALYKHKYRLIKLKLNVILIISMGSFCGGILGEIVFNGIKNQMQNELLLKLIQSISLMIVLIVIIIYSLFRKHVKTYKISSKVIIFITGLFLGSISVFLGIGGGPLNIIMLSILFSYEMKESVIYSITTVFFAQLSKLSQVYIQNQFRVYDARLVLCICFFALLGGYIGTRINQRINVSSIERVYLFTIFFLVFITVYNIIYGISKLIL
jgi:uncharacterized membrane protein YfcA